MKRVILFLVVAVMTITCTESKATETPVNALTTLHAKVMQILKSDAVLESDLKIRRHSEGINFSVGEDSWINVPKTGDVLFSFDFYENSYAGKAPIRITRSTKNGENLQRCLTMLMTNVLPLMIGYDSTLKVMSPFFNKVSNAFYMQELERVKKKFMEIALTGTPHGESGLSFSKDGYSGRYLGPGKWEINKFITNERVYISSPFITVTDYGSSGAIMLMNNGVVYRCGMFGCEKRVFDRNSKESNVPYKDISITLEEFKLKSGYKGL